MPELPEVETTLRGIQPHIQYQLIQRVLIRHYGLRWPIPRCMKQKLQQQQIQQLSRRGKYLLLQLTHGTAIIHLGMSGSLRILPQAAPPLKHDHFDIVLANNTLVRFTDPRRFGAFLWTEQQPSSHHLLKNLGPEPLGKAFNANYLWRITQTKKALIKALIMDSHVVVGVGNIYATEALFMARIHPQLAANRLDLAQISQLVKAIKRILRQAIQRGGTTLKDFVGADGKPGYFANQLQVYGRAGLDCYQCHSKLFSIRIGQRSSVYCPQCQPYETRE